MAGELDIILEDFLHVFHSKIINSFFSLPLRVNETKVGVKNAEKCEIILLPIQSIYQIYQIGLKEI